MRNVQTHYTRCVYIYIYTHTQDTHPINTQAIHTHTQDTHPPKIHTLGRDAPCGTQYDSGLTNGVRSTIVSRSSCESSSDCNNLCVGGRRICLVCCVCDDVCM